MDTFLYLIAVLLIVLFIMRNKVQNKTFIDVSLVILIVISIFLILIPSFDKGTDKPSGNTHIRNAIAYLEAAERCYVNEGTLGFDPNGACSNLDNLVGVYLQEHGTNNYYAEFGVENGTVYLIEFSFKKEVFDVSLDETFDINKVNKLTEDDLR